MLSLRTPTCAAARPCASRPRLVAARSGNGTTSGAISEGQRVKVTTTVKVYNAPKQPQGLDLQGMEGTVVKNVTEYKGKVLSANFPFKVEFVLEAEGKPAKFQVHLGEEELQAL